MESCQQARPISEAHHFRDHLTRARQTNKTMLANLGQILLETLDGVPQKHATWLVGSVVESVAESSSLFLFSHFFSHLFLIELCQYQQENSINCQKGKTFGKLLVLWTKDLWFNQKSNPNKWNRVGKGKNQQAVHHSRVTINPTSIFFCSIPTISTCFWRNA